MGCVVTRDVEYFIGGKLAGDNKKEERTRLTWMRMIGILVWIHLGFLAKASTNTRHHVKV